LTKKTPYKGLGADSEEKHEPASDINTEGADSLRALDPKRPIREADGARSGLLPMRSTRPTISWPGTIGYLMPGSSASTT
jgi:hypothetical protein